MGREIESDNRSRYGVGEFLYWGGFFGVMLAVGAAAGYYAGAYGVRWLPTMLAVVLGICILSLVSIICSRLVEGSVRKVTAKGLVIRRRVTACLVLVCVAIIGQLGVYWTQQGSPLTDLTPEQFEDAFSADLEQYKQCDQEIENYLLILETYARENFGDDKQRVLTGEEEKLLRDIWLGIYDYGFALEQIHTFYQDWYRFDPSRSQYTYHHRSFLLTFAAELSLFKKSTRLMQIVTEYPNAVRFLDAPHAGTEVGGKSFSRFREEFQGTRDQSRVIAGRQYLLWLDKGLKGKKVAGEVGCGWLWEKAKVELGLIDSISVMDMTKLTADSDFQAIKRGVGKGWFTAQKKIATAMGNTRVRRVGEYLITAEQRETMDESLLPGDIMISRKNWYLSNVGLPGFWPHAILYIGGPEKLEAYFDDAAVKEYLAGLGGEDVGLSEYLSRRYPAKWMQYSLGKDSQAYRVIEGVSPGVVLHTLEQACGDYMSAMRPRLSKVAKAQAVIEAFGHLGKPYDYNFDFATDHALVCTELVWRSYRAGENKDGIEFRLEQIAGRTTMPANNIVKLFADEHGKDDAQMDFVYFLDAVEAEGKCFVASEDEFIKSCQRAKWSFVLE